MAAARGWEVTRHVLLDSKKDSQYSIEFKVQGSFKDSVELWAL